MSTTKEARNDAREYARAQMFYGEGAGTRRKLITASVESKARRNPAYAREFHTELARQDMAEHASKAQVERHRQDRNEAVSRNIRGALTGNSKSLNTSVLIIGVIVYLAHETGYDKKAIAKGKAIVANLRARRNRRKNVHSVTNITNSSSG